jgi:hypothetical protein
VKVDIILDPYILDLLPHSLLPTSVYILCVALGAYFVSGHAHAYIRGLIKAKEDENKPKVS